MQHVSLFCFWYSFLQRPSAVEENLEKKLYEGRLQVWFLCKLRIVYPTVLNWKVTIIFFFFLLLGLRSRHSNFESQPCLQFAEGWKSGTDPDCDRYFVEGTCLVDPSNYGTKTKSVCCSNFLEDKVNQSLQFQTTGSDTIVTHNGKIYEKPADVEDAVRFGQISISCFFGGSLENTFFLLQNHLNFEWVHAHCLQRS